MREVLTHNDSEAAAEVSSMTVTILEDLAFVKAMIDEYGNTLFKRWQKRSIDKRSAMLLQAMPEMSKRKWTAAWLGLERANIINSGKKLVKTPAVLDLLPYLDLPSLSQDASLLLALLHNRSHHKPSEWALFDSEQVKVPFNLTTYIQVAYNPHCVSMNGETFGKLITSDATRAHNFDIVGYPRARIILQAQSALSTLLRRITKTILECQLDSAAKGRDLWDAMSASGFRKSTHTVSISVRFNQPFSAPPKFNLRQVVETLRSRRDAAADELWLLQVDPAYTRQYLAQRKSNGKYNALGEQQRQQYVVSWMLLALEMFNRWQEMVRQAEKVIDIEIRCQSEVKGRERLQVEYANALRGLQYTLEIHFGALLASLRHRTANAGTFEYYFNRDSNGIVKSYVKDEDDIFEEDPLLWNLIGLKDYYHPLALDPSWHIAFIDDVLTSASPRERARIDTALYNHISDLAAMSDAVSAMKRSKPYYGPKMNNVEWELANITFPRFWVPDASRTTIDRECYAGPLASTQGFPRVAEAVSQSVQGKLRSNARLPQ